MPVGLSSLFLPSNNLFNIGINLNLTWMQDGITLFPCLSAGSKNINHKNYCQYNCMTWCNPNKCGWDIQLFFKTESFFMMICHNCFCCSTFSSLRIHRSLAYLSSSFLLSPSTHALVSAPQCTLNIAVLRRVNRPSVSLLEATVGFYLTLVNPYFYGRQLTSQSKIEENYR